MLVVDYLNSLSILNIVLFKLYYFLLFELLNFANKNLENVLEKILQRNMSLDNKILELWSDLYFSFLVVQGHKVIVLLYIKTSLFIWVELGKNFVLAMSLLLHMLFAIGKLYKIETIFDLVNMKKIWS